MQAYVLLLNMIRSVCGQMVLYYHFNYNLYLKILLLFPLSIERLCGFKGGGYNFNIFKVIRRNDTPVYQSVMDCQWNVVQKLYGMSYVQLHVYLHWHSYLSLFMCHLSCLKNFVQSNFHPVTSCSCVIPVVTPHHSCEYFCQCICYNNSLLPGAHPGVHIRFFVFDMRI